MKLLLHTFLIFLLLEKHVAHAQIGISGSAHPSAALDVKSPGNDKAFYPPRLTTAQRNAIPNPQAGAFVYDIEKGTMYLHDGQSWLPLATLNPTAVPPISRTASDGIEGDYFGSSVAISGNYAIVGAYNKGVNSPIQGAAYVFVRSGYLWTQQQRLTASDGTAGDYFGYSVAISGDYIVVGAYNKNIGANSNQGIAYVFNRSGDTWSEVQQLKADDGAMYDRFGISVAISGDYAIVGASSKTVQGNSNQGAAYIFSRSGSTWTQQQKVTAADGTASDSFGCSVAIDGVTALIGACNKTYSTNTNQGVAYIFTRSENSWTQRQQLIPIDRSSNDFFGRSVALSGDYAVIGANGKSINNLFAQGSAFVFFRASYATWLQTAQLTASDGAMSDYFGTSVSISGDYIVVGAYNKNGNTVARQGATYLFKKNSMAPNSYIQRRITDNSGENTRNGYSVGISNGTFIIGSSFGVGKVSFGTVD